MTRAAFLLATVLVWTSGATALAAGCLPADDLATIEAARARVDTVGPLVWPRWTAAPPVLVRSGDHDCLVHHPDPPAPFVPVGPGTARMEGHVLPVPAATALDLGGTWTVVVPARAELQAFLDEHLGPDVVVLDEALYTRTVLHEAFHAHQMTVLGGPGGVPDFGATVAPSRLAERLATLPAAASARAAQGRALHEAVTAPTTGAAVAAVERFLAARDAWHGRAPPGTGPWETGLEWLEGSARYADVLLALYPDPLRSGTDDAWDDLLADVRDPSGIASGVRDEYAALGAAQAFLLDRLYPGWKPRALPGGASLASLLREVVEDRAGIPAPLRGMAVRTVRVDGTPLRVAVADAGEDWAQGLRDVTALGSLDGVWFVFPDDVSAPFWMRGARQALEIAFFDAAGRGLASFTMPTCGSDACPRYRPELPYRSALETPVGRWGPHPPRRLTVP